MPNKPINRRSFLRKTLAIATTLFVGIATIKRKALAISPEVILFNRNRVTPATAIPDTYSKPVFFPRTNNLRRKAGSPFLAQGELLIIRGQITDLIDVPIENATVKIWQANHFGYYNHQTEEGEVDKHDVDVLSAGMCVSDNAGKYAFTTIMPGYYGHRAPHIHFLIEHETFESLETEMLFPSHPRNQTDKKWNLLTPAEKALITCFLRNVDEREPSSGKIATFNIKLDGLHHTKRY